jgi:hypothetical protein
LVDNNKMSTREFMLALGQSLGKKPQDMEAFIAV